MTDFVELILPGVVSLVLGAIAAIVIPMLRRSATLRRQLEADASIVQQLADQAAIELRLDMGHRSAHLVAHSRFPGWTPLDIGLLLIAWLAAGLVAICGVESLRSAGAHFDTTALLAVSMATGTQVGVMYVAFRGWQARMIARVYYPTAVTVLRNAVAWFAARGVVVERVLSDNGSAYKSNLWRDTCAELAITVKKTRPYRPQTNGKIERFHRTLADRWAFKKLYNSESARRAALPAWIHEYNHHRPHSAIGKVPPMTRLNQPGWASHLGGEVTHVKPCGSTVGWAASSDEIARPRQWWLCPARPVGLGRDRTLRPTLWRCSAAGCLTPSRPARADPRKRRGPGCGRCCPQNSPCSPVHSSRARCRRGRLAPTPRR